MKFTSEKQSGSRFSGILLSFWCGAAGWFTVLALVIMLLGLLIGSERFSNVIEIHRFLLLFLCGCGLSAARLLRRTSIPPLPGLFLHYFITLLSLFLFLWIPTGNITFTSSMLFVLIVTALYAVIRSVIHWIASSTNKNRKEF